VIKYESLFDRGGLSLDRLRNFVLIAELGGVSRAAQGDPGRMSLFSRQIKELEGFFGSPLTRRQGRSIQLTEAGQQLARLARAYLNGLEDFQQTCRNLPQTLSIASGNSVLEWLVLPHIAGLRQALPNTRFEFQSGRTQDLVQRLTDMSVDVVLVREDAVVRPLKCKRVAMLTYALFLPKPMAAGLRPENLKSAMTNLPLATSVGGQFRDQLVAAADQAGWPLRIELSCSSFTQAARVVKSGGCGAVLPNLAAAEFAPEKVVSWPLPFLKSYARPICLAWNPRLVEVRPVVTQAINALAKHLTASASLA
jgi:DNA-binding transcriptional LysR family regulator